MNSVMNDNLTNRPYSARIVLIVSIAVLPIFLATQAFGDVAYSFYEDWSTYPPFSYSNPGPYTEFYPWPTSPWAAYIGPNSTLTINNNTARFDGSVHMWRWLSPYERLEKNTTISFNIEGQVFPVENNPGQVEFAIYISGSKYGGTHIHYILDCHEDCSADGYPYLHIEPGDWTRNLYQDCIDAWANVGMDFESWKDNPETFNGYVYVKVVIISTDNCVYPTSAQAIIGTISIVTWKPPVASFYWQPYYPIGGEVTFDASYSYDPDGGEITGYTWDFGDGNTAQGKVVTHTYAEPGIYDVNLTVMDDEGETTSTSANINVIALEIEVVDPYPALMSNGDDVITDPNRLADGGNWANGLTADGITPLLIRAQVFGSGTVEFGLQDENGDPTAVGTLSTPGGSQEATTLDVTVNEPLRDGRYMAFAVLTAPPAFFRGPGDESLQERPITIEANFTPSEGGNEATDNYETWLVRPPVIMVHGLWSNESAFSILRNELSNNGFIDDKNFLSRCHYNNSASFSTIENDLVLPIWVTNVLGGVREYGYACQKVDIVGHSMGGLLAKRLPTGFAQQNVRKIITIGSPYWGSPLADRLYDFYTRYPPIGQWLEERINRAMSTRDAISGGAVQDLKVEDNNELPIPTQIPGVDCENIIVGLRDWSIHFFLTVIRVLTGLDLDLEAIHDDIFGPDIESDWVVSEASQQGSEPSLPSSPVVWHCTETEDDDILSRVLQALNFPAQIGESSSKNFMSAEWSYSSMRNSKDFEESKYSTTSDPNGTVEITEPNEGQTCTSGQSISVSIQGTGDTTHAAVFAHFGSSSWSDIVELPWQGDVNVPADCVGSDAQVAAIGLDPNTDMTDEDEVNLVLDSNVVLESIFFGFGDKWTFDFRTFPQQSHEFQLYPMGVFSDGSEHPLSVVSDEVVYESYDQTIASVDPNGLISLHSRGTTWIIVTCATRTAYLQIVVEAFIGDLNLNGMVDFSDLTILAGQWLQPPAIPSADIAPQPYGDGIVNFLDFAILAKDWLGVAP